MKPLWLAGGLLLAVAGCVAVEDPALAPAPAEAEARPAAPAGHGTLRQDQVTLTLRDGAVQVRVTPLEEEIIRLTAPDTYRRLSEVAVVPGQPDMERAGGRTRFLVAFGALQPGQQFRPEDLVVESGGRVLRPARIHPLTPGWGEQRLQPSQGELAIYEFDTLIDLMQPLVVRYGLVVNDRWQSMLPAIQAEQTRVLSRGGSR